MRAPGIVIASALALFASNSLAQAVPPASPPAAEQPSTDSRPVLWQNIRYGMTREEVMALYPSGRNVQQHRASTDLIDFTVVGTCQAEVNIHYPHGTVETVVVKGNPSLGGRCSDTVLTALSARYGETLSRERTERSILAREGQIFVWNRDGIALRFKRFTNGIFAGGGLARASWELTYSTVADDVAL